MIEPLPLIKVYSDFIIHIYSFSVGYWQMFYETIGLLTLKCNFSVCSYKKLKG